MVIFAIPSAFSYLMSSNSPADSHCMLVMQGIIWDLETPHRGSSSTSAVRVQSSIRKVIEFTD
jgi:hypothetical protein